MKAKAWLVLTAKRNAVGKVASVRVVRVTQNKPDIGADDVAFQIEVDVDTAWFDTPTAQISVNLPAPTAPPPPATVTHGVVKVDQVVARLNALAEREGFT